MYNIFNKICDKKYIAIQFAVFFYFKHIIRFVYCLFVIFIAIESLINRIRYYRIL